MNTLYLEGQTESCFALPTLSILSLLLPYDALLKFLSGLNSHLLVLVLPRRHTHSFLFSLFSTFRVLISSPSRFLPIPFPCSRHHHFDHPSLLGKGSVSLLYEPADVRFSHLHQHSSPLTQRYSLSLARI
jgi:hypothetical protein